MRSLKSSLSIWTFSTKVDGSSKELPILKTMSVKAAIKNCLQIFFEERRASGGARPCGPYDMDSIYQAIFDIAKEDLKNENFLSGLRRTCLGQSKDKEKNASESVSGKQKKNNGQKG